jgi:predicted nucleotidyltransferase
VKPLLYVFRVLLTGLHLMRTGTIEANLPRLNEVIRLPYIDDLIARKRAESERTTLEDAELGFFAAEYERLVADLERARDESALPEQPSARHELHELLLRLRYALLR